MATVVTMRLMTDAGDYLTDVNGDYLVVDVLVEPPVIQGDTSSVAVGASQTSSSALDSGETWSVPVNDGRTYSERVYP